MRNRKCASVPTVFGGAIAVALALALLASAGAGSAQAPGIQVDRARAGIPIGTSLTINVTGAVAPLTVAPSFDGVDAVYDPVKRRLLLTGRSAGSGTVSL